MLEIKYNKTNLVLTTLNDDLQSIVSGDNKTNTNYGTNASFNTSYHSLNTTNNYINLNNFSNYNTYHYSKNDTFHHGKNDTSTIKDSLKKGSQNTLNDSLNEFDFRSNGNYN